MDAGKKKKESPNDSIVAFDTLYTTNEIQLMKIAMPLLSHDLQLLLAAFIKVRELSFCYQMLQHTRLHDFSIETDRMHQFFQEAKPYCTKQQRNMFAMFENLSRTMQILEKMKLPGDHIPLDLDGNMDFGTLMQLMPLFQSFQDDSSKGHGTDEKSEKKEGSKDTHTGNEACEKPKSPPMAALSPLLKNALTEEQKEMYERFQQKFSSM